MSIAREIEATPWCPDKCPITGREFFCWIESEDGTQVPTYGGPFDSYTLPEADEDGGFTVRHYDHDEGCWNDYMSLGLRLINDQREDYPFGTVDELKAKLAALRQRVEGESLTNEPKGLGLACTVAWTELVTAMRKDGHAVNDSSGPNTRAWIESIVRDAFTAPATPATFDRAKETPRRQRAVETLLALGYTWDGTAWAPHTDPPMPNGWREDVALAAQMLTWGWHSDGLGHSEELQIKKHQAKLLAMLEAAPAPAAEKLPSRDDDTTWYVNDDTGSISVDIEYLGLPPLSLLLKRDGTAHVIGKGRHASLTSPDALAIFREHFAPAAVVDEATQDAIDSILHKLEEWSKAYPVDVFPEPTERQRDWLHEASPGLMDRISACMGRHMAKMLSKDIASLRAALSGKQGEQT